MGGGLLSVLSDLFAADDTATWSLTGSGTAADPYVIDSSSDYQEFFDTVNADSTGTYRSATYSLEVDVNVSDFDVTSTEDGTTTNSYQAPIGTSTYPFTGVFDGNGHTVTLSISDTESTGTYLGLFGYVSGGTIEDVVVAGSVAGYTEVGGAVGYAENATIEGVVNQASVSEAYYTGSLGGVVGVAAGTTSVVDCGNTGAVTAEFATAYKPSVSGSSSYTNAAGGVVGRMHVTTVNEISVEDCYNQGSVSGNATTLGGIVGCAFANANYTAGSMSVSDSYNTGSVAVTKELSLDTYVGGIVGTLDRSSTSASETALSIERCYSAGALSSASTGSVCLGGILSRGFLHEECYSDNYYLEGSASYGVYDGNTQYVEEEGLFETCTETELKASGFYLDLGAAYADDAESAYNSGYPILRWQDSSYDGNFTIVARIADEKNESSDKAISLAVTDSSGTDVTSSFSSVTSSSSVAEWTWSSPTADTYSYSVSKEGYETASGTVTVESDASVGATVDLDSVSYSFTLTASPSAANVDMVVNGDAVEADSTTTDSSAGTRTFVYSGLYNSDAISYTVTAYGYESVEDTVSISFADASASVALSISETHAVTVSVSTPDDVSTAPYVLLYYQLEGSSYDGTCVYDSRDDNSTYSSASGGYTYSATGIVEGDYEYVVYLSGYPTETGAVSVEDDISTAVTIAPTSEAWDGEEIDVGWYVFSDSTSDYYICSAAQLAGLSAIVGGGAVDYDGSSLSSYRFPDKTVHLSADIDLGGDEGVYWTPIGAYTAATSSGTVSNSFQGSFDGEGHTISNMLVGDNLDSSGNEATARLHSQKTSSGLFSLISAATSSSEPYVKDIVIKDATVSEDANAYVSSTGSVLSGVSTSDPGAGVLTGRTVNVSLFNVTVEGGSVSNDDKYAGGLVGRAISDYDNDYEGDEATFEACSNSASVINTVTADEVKATTDTYVYGGIAGQSSTEIVGCSNLGSVTSYDIAGGIVGNLSCGVSECSNSGSVSVTSTDSTYYGHGAGGIAGVSGKFTIDACFNTGAISSTGPSAGGILGAPTANSEGNYIGNCYNRGTVTSNGSAAGGIVGSFFTGSSTSITDSADAYIYNCYSAASAVTASSYAGALVGYITKTNVSSTNYLMYNCYSDLTINGSQSNIGYNAGNDTLNFTGIAQKRNTATLQTYASTLGDAFADDLGNYDGYENINDGYPVLTWQVSEYIVYADVTDADGNALANQAYTGDAIAPEIAVTLFGETLTEGTDYTVEYSNNIDIGTATVTITGAGDLIGTATVTFEITAGSIEGAEVTLESSSYIYTGASIEPAVTVTLDGETLSAYDSTTLEGDYTVSYSDNVNAGTATVIVTGAGNYTGTETGSFEIKYDIAGSDSDETLPSVVIAEIANQTYTGEAIEPELTVTYGTTTLTAGTDYTVSYADNTEVGTATVTLTGTGNFTGTVAASFAIVDFTSINANIESAKTILESVTVSADGSDVSEGSSWVTQETYDALSEAISAAEAAVSSSSATSAAVEAALAALNEAIETFNNSTTVATPSTNAGSSGSSGSSSGSSAGSSSSGAKKASKKSQKMKVTKRNKTVKAKKLRKKAQKVKAITVKNAKGKLSFKKVSGSKRLSLVKGGRIKVKRGTKKGTYKIKVKVTAKGNSTYKSASKTVIVKIKVK